MKQLIVLVASVILGIGIGGIVLGFNDTAQSLATSAQGGLGEIATAMENAMENATSGPAFELGD